MSDSLIGQVLLDQFRVDAFVDAGGMSIVYRVRDLRRNADLAMKVLRSELAEDPSAFKRFQREANSLGKLSHPNIVPFYGAFHTADITFLLERYIDGPSLKGILQQQAGKPLLIGEAMVYLKALCAALGYAHANGIVHCDVKPGNVMVDRGGIIYLTDFGIARHVDSTTTTLAGAGTAAYITPEQIRSDAVTAATDVYALSIVLYEMLAGRRPFRGNEPGTETGGGTANERIRYAHLHLLPLDPCAVNASIPPALGEVILKALNKNPTQRYPTVAKFFAAACSAAGITGDQIPGRVSLLSMPVGPTGAEPTLHQGPERVSPPAWRGAQRWLPWGGGALVIILIVAMLSRIGSSSTSLQLFPSLVPSQSASSPTTAPAAVTATDPAASSAPDPVVTVNVKSDNAILRSCLEFTDDCSLNISYPKDQSLTVLGKNATGEWYLVQGPEGASGWLFKDWLGFPEGGLDVPVAATTVDAAPTQSSATAYESPTDLPTQTPVDTPTAPPSSSNYSEPTGKIVFTCQIGRNAKSDQICVMNADGSDLRQLTHNAYENYYPSIAPDGKSVLFVSNQTGNFEIYEMDLSGGERQLTSGIGELAAPEISPDGGQIVFTNNYDELAHIWVMQRSGKNPHKVYGSSDSDALDPSWSPDGQRILFALGTGEDRQLYTVAKNGSGPSRVSSAFRTRGRSDWSPNGSTIASYSGASWQREIYLMNADGTNLHQISQGGNAQAPSFSPEGGWLAFTGYSSTGDENGCEIYVMRIDGSDLRRETKNNYCDYQPRWGP